MVETVSQTGHPEGFQAAAFGIFGDAVIAEISMMSSEWRIVQFEYSDHHKSKSGIPFFSQQPNKHQKFVFGV